MRLKFMAGAMAAATATLMLPAMAAAQPGGVSATCSIDPNSPKELALQSLAFNRAKSAQNADERKKVLTGVLKELDTKPDRFSKNPLGYNYILSQALVLWAVEPGVGAMPTRGSLGFVSNPSEPYDIIDGIDKSFKAMVAAAPECEEEVKGLRQNEAWLALTQAALSASNGGNLDSAEYYAKASMKMSAESPYPHYVLANVANTRGDKKSAILHWGHVASLAGSDTSYRDLKNGALTYSALTKLELASSAQGSEQQTLGKEAAEAFKAALEFNPETPDAANLYNGWADALTLAKDEASLPQVYAPLLSAPEKANDITLTMAGVIATRANKAEDAARLFEEAVKRNPNSRDALRNLAATLHGIEKYKEMFAPSAKLVEIDPNNYDGWMMFAYASQGLGKAATAAAEKKAWTDSLVKYNNIAEALPVRVEVTGFTRGASSATLQLQLHQVAEAGGNYAVTVEFLDVAGNVVATATEQSGPLKKDEKKEVSFKGEGDKIYGYRYKAIK